MKMTIVFLFTSLFVLPFAGYARQDDSLRMQKTYKMDEVVVTGTRNETDVRHLPFTVSVLNRSTIEEDLRLSLLPLLSEQVPGVFATSRGLMGYGVSGGSAGDISLRGLSGSSSRMMVLIDGHPQYMGLMGHPVADAYQSMLAERVEVLRGPASVLYGSNAMGGVINIVTRGMRHDGAKTSLRAGYGSYNTLETEFTSRILKRRFSAVLGATYNRSDGHRDNMFFEQIAPYVKFGYRVDDHWHLGADVDFTRYAASQPGTLARPLQDADQRVSRGVTSLALTNDYKHTSGGLSVFYNWGKHWINDGYAVDSEGNGNPRLYRFNSRDRLLGVSAYQSGELFRGNRLTGGVDYFAVGGEAWNKYVEGNRKDEREDIADKTLHEIAAYIDFRQHIGSFLTLDAGIRADHHSRMGTEWIPQAGLSFHLPFAIELKASASKGFRYPTLREMYMFPPQNPDLRPERMWNYEVAWSQSLFGGRLAYGVNLFHIDADNLVVAVPREGSTPQNQNTGSLHHNGIEAQVAFRINACWALDANYSYLHMKKPVIAAPEHKFHAGAVFSKKRWNISTTFQYVAGLYTSTAPVVQEEYLLWNMRVRYRFAPWLHFWVRGENLLAQRYEINFGYPMPKATAMIGVQIHF
jgi:iron complex outermembrane receptor protein